MKTGKSAANSASIPAPWVILTLALAFFALLYAAPSLLQIPGTDSSIFQYIGARVREGVPLYRGVYDHKPPLVFYLDALGLWLGGRWGIWALELVSLSAAALLVLAFLRRAFGLIPAVIAVVAFLANLTFVHDGGNLTEEYALPLQFLSFFFLMEMETRKKAGWRPFAIGLALGLASSLKQPLAGPAVAIGVYLLATRLSRRDGRGLWSLVWIALGAGAVWAIWAAWFAAQGLLPDFWEAAFAHNFAVSAIPLNQRIAALTSAVSSLSGLSIFYLVGLLAWIAALIHLLLHEERLLKALTSRWIGLAVAALGLLLIYNGAFKSGLALYALSSLSLYRVGLILAGLALAAAGMVYFSRRLAGRWFTALRRLQPTSSSGILLPLALGVVDLPVELGLSALSGTNFLHYFMALLPSLTLLIGFFAYAWISFANPHAKRSMPYVWLGVFLIPLLLPGVAATAGKVHYSRDRQVGDASDFIQAHTQPGAPIFQWGNVPMIYLAAGHISPSRFFHTNPLFLKGFITRVQTGILLRDFQANPPALIVYAPSLGEPLLYTPNAGQCPNLKDAGFLQTLAEKDPVMQVAPDAQANEATGIPPGMGDVYAWICQNYVSDAKVGPQEWQVYRYEPDRR